MKLFNGPIIRVLIILSLLAAPALLIIPTRTVLSILNSFVIAGGLFVVVRFGRAAIVSLFEPRPQSEDWWLVGGVGASLSLAVIRLIVVFDHEFASSALFDHLASAFTFILAFSLFLKGGAPAFTHEQRQFHLSPFGLSLLALVLGLTVDGALRLIIEVFG